MLRINNLPRKDTVYLVVTILATKNNFILRLTKPKSLAPNQFAYALTVNVDPKDWFDRILDVQTTKVVPPEIADLTGHIDFSKTTGQKVMDRMTGRTP